MPNILSQRTLEVFEDASASIPLRQLDRAFQGAGILAGEDPGGPVGARRAQFRRYIASVDQSDPHQLHQLGDALGALIEEVAASKVEFLVKAAERDGFVFANDVFRPAVAAIRPFAVANIADIAFVEDCSRRLHLVANDRPRHAIDGANEVVESSCRTVLRLIGASAPGEGAGLVEVVRSTLGALEPVSRAVDDVEKSPAFIGRCLDQLCAVVRCLDEWQTGQADHERDGGTGERLSPRHARLAIGAALTVVGFIAETYLERAAPKTY